MIFSDTWTEFVSKYIQNYIWDIWNEQITSQTTIVDILNFIYV